MGVFYGRLLTVILVKFTKPCLYKLGVLRLGSLPILAQLGWPECDWVSEQSISMPYVRIP